MTRRIAAGEGDMLALEALTYLAGSPDDLALFMRHCGVDPAGLRRHAGDPEFLAGVLDYFLGDEKLLTRFCERQGIDPATVSRLRAALTATDTAR